MHEIYLFVYGTLMHGCSNNGFLIKSEGTFIEEVAVHNFLLLDLGSFPAAIKNEGTKIVGELWKVKTLEFTDHLEGYPHFYNRVSVPVVTKKSNCIEAQIYYINKDKVQSWYKPIENGNWKELNNRV